jgi:hypothetical protein
LGFEEKPFKALVPFFFLPWFFAVKHKNCGQSLQEFQRQSTIINIIPFNEKVSKRQNLLLAIVRLDSKKLNENIFESVNCALNQKPLFFYIVVADFEMTRRVATSVIFFPPHTRQRERRERREKEHTRRDELVIRRGASAF